jgi:hypothetical protein
VKPLALVACVLLTLALTGCAADDPSGCELDIDVHHPKTTITKTAQPKPAATTKRK